MKNIALFLGLGVAVSIPSFMTSFTALSLSSAQSQEPKLTEAASSLVFQSAMVPGKDSLELKNARVIRRALEVQAQQLRQWQEEQRIDRTQPRQSSALSTQELQSESRATEVIQLGMDPLAITHPSPSLTIRVAIGQGLQTIVAGGSTPIQILNPERRIIQEVPASTAVVFQGSQGIRWNEVKSTAPIWLHPQNDGFVFIGDRWYRGGVLLVPQGNSILVVNYVDLEQYLYSVVGAEMPSSWSSEALKAQAIAARSYAVVHHQRPANSWYDLTNSERHQVYGGLDTETSQSQASVESTRGLVLMKHGQLFEAMYAATDAIVAKYHASYQSMSQTGAQQKAITGFDHLQILDSYYRSAYLARIVP
ncbi:SpoIID/LytB domain-containing protein [Cyanobacteria bacterium FACHB-63]|nr:SpoIID/LytB domain-containing protein [Cyanobacteria bacterium FACHB-63]